MKRITAFLVSILIFAAGLVSCGKTVEAKWQEQLDLGMRYLEEMDYENAILAFTKAIEVDPNRSEAYVERAKLYVQRGAEGDLALAAADYEKAIELGEDTVDVFLALAVIYEEQGDLDKALAIIQQGYDLTGAPELLEKLEALQVEEEAEEIEESELVESVAKGGKLHCSGWKIMERTYFEVCDKILDQYREGRITELATSMEFVAYLRNQLSLPIREAHQTEKTTFYYGEVNANGIPTGLGICVYATEEKLNTEAYVGTLSQGMRDGQGVLVTDSSYYIGGWNEDCPDGYGEEYYIYENENRVSCTKGTTNMGKAEGYWLECWYENGELPREDGNEDNGTQLAGYRYLCKDGKAVSLGPVPETAWWYGYLGYGITEPAGDLMVEAYIVYEDGSEIYEPAPHEHAGGIQCSRCRSGESNGFHAYEPLPQTYAWMGFFFE